MINFLNLGQFSFLSDQIIPPPYYLSLLEASLCVCLSLKKQVQIYSLLRDFQHVRLPVAALEKDSLLMDSWGCLCYERTGPTGSILPSRMGKHGVSWENMETIEKIEASTRWLKTLYFLFKHQNILFVTQNTVFGNQMTKTLYLIAVMSTVEKS